MTTASRNEGGALRRAPAGRQFSRRRVGGRWFTVVLAAAALATALGSAAAQAPEAPYGSDWPDDPVTNLDHLEFLTTEFEVEGEQQLGVWIYAEPSPTEPDAYVGREAPGEGVTDLDDVARAVVAYLWHHDATGSERSLEQAKGLLGYVLAMQAETGQFYNFVFADGTINRLGITSRKGAGFWAARAMWALAEGITSFADEDPAFAVELRAAFLRGVTPFEAKIAPTYGTYDQRHGFESPTWLPDDGADAASNLLLGLSIFLESEENEGVRRLQSMVADGLMALQYGPEGAYPFLAHMPFARDPLDWHAWGSRQTQALAQATLASADAEPDAAAAYLASAEAEAGHFFVHLLVDKGPYSNMNPAVRAYPQIAYGMEAIASGYFALADASGKTVYERLGGLMASWLLGNNSLRQAMYDPETGRVYDGLERGVINRNAGAESTITGLMALVQAEARPEARAVLDYMWLEAHSEFTVEAETGTDFGEAPSTEVDGTASGQLAAVLKPGASLALTAEVPAAGRYLVYALYRDDPWDASAAVFVGRERLGTVATTGAEESRYVMTELGAIDLEAGPISLTLSHAADRDFRFDALLFRPVVEWKLYGREGSRLVLIKSWSPDDERVGAELVPSLGAVSEATVNVYDARANEVGSTPGGLEDAADLTLPPYGFALVEWPDDAPLPELGLTTARLGPLVGLEIAFDEPGFVAMDLGPSFNADAFSLPSRPQRGNFDNRSGVYGATYPAEYAPKASMRFEAGRVPFLFPPTDTELNNVVMLGQRLEVPAGRYAALHLLGASDQGNYQADIQLVYEDGSEALTLGLSDWCQPPRFGEAIGVEFAQRRGTSGQTERIICRILHQTLPVDPERTLVRIDLPDRETMHLFALTLEAPNQE